MSDPDDTADYPPATIPGLDRDHPAVVRPGEVSPHPDATEPIVRGSTVTEWIWAAEDLRRVAREWWRDSAWPPLRERLEAAYAELLDQHDPTESQKYRKQRIEGLLSIRPSPTDTQRLDWLEESHLQVNPPRDPKGQWSVWLFAGDGTEFREGKTLREAIDKDIEESA